VGRVKHRLCHSVGTEGRSLGSKRGPHREEDPRVPLAYATEMATEEYLTACCQRSAGLDEVEQLGREER
jgi:hypothetical protein